MTEKVTALRALAELEKRRKWEDWKGDPELFFRECLKIYPKDSSLGLIPLEINSAQKIVLDELNRQMDEIGYVRIIISKYRQAGFSTISSAFIFHRAIFYGNTNSVIISLDRPTTESIFSMSQTFHEYLPSDIKPILGKSNAREMVFANKSKYRVFTAGAEDPGRGTTNSALLCDEAAFFQKGEKVLAGLFQSVAMTKGSIIIINSTSNGATGMYYDLWNKAEKGEGYFKSLFVPWYLQDEYRLKAPLGFEQTFEEKKLVATYSLDDDQLYWRRIKIAETSSVVYKQEYPFTAEESFIQSGSNVFDVEMLSRYVPMDAESIRDYNRDYSTFDEVGEGPLQVWSPPSRDLSYIIGADVAQGVGADHSVAVVMDQERRIVALYRNNRIEPGAFGQLLFYLGRWYNNAILCPESNAIGHSTIQTLHHMQYPNIYKQRKTANTTIDTINHLGFKTTSATKAPIISNLQTLIKDEDIDIPSVLMLQELKDFIIYPSEGQSNVTRMGASPGKHDDTVMALAITCEVYRTDGDRLTNNAFSWRDRNSYIEEDTTNWI